MFGQKLLWDIGRQEGVEHIIRQVLRDKQAMLTRKKLGFAMRTTVWRKSWRQKSN